MTDPATNIEPRSIADRWADDEDKDGFVMIKAPVETAPVQESGQTES